MTSGQGRRFVEPRGYAAITLASTAMIVAGVGLAWTGLLLAAAGVVLSIIGAKELVRANPWIIDRASPESSPMMAPDARRIGRVSVAVTVIGAAVALGAFQVSDQETSVIPPALVSGLTMLFFNAQLRRVLERPPGE